MGKAKEITQDFEEAKKKFEHFRDYIKKIEKDGPLPEFIPELSRDMKGRKVYDLIYPVGDPLFVHIRTDSDKGTTEYNIIEPEFTDKEEKLYEKIVDKLVDIAYKEPVPDKIIDIGPVLLKLLDEVVHVKGNSLNVFDNFVNKKIGLSKDEFEKIKYFLLRNRVGYGKLEPLFYDKHLEDIHCTGTGQVTTQHKIFDMVYTSIIFKDDRELDAYIGDVTERVERPASDAQAVVDAMMPDGSRANFIYGKEISLEGSSFTVRKFADVPISVTQLIKWNTIDPTLAAYLWLALENGMNLFVCGETASGKTTTLNAISSFIKPDAKVYTVENTPEVTMPHDVWQHLVTREAGKESDVTYFDLLIAALRSRPDYIIVGEIRGEEGRIAFQAMQTGHPVMSTFHAGNVTTMVQRITGDPINVPIAFVDNLNLVLIQQAVSRKGRMIRRVLSLTELERYYEPAHKMVTREVFTWNTVTDEHMFRGLFNSYILEQKIAKMLGMSDPREIYDQLEHRSKILQKMADEGIVDYYTVWDLLKKYHHDGMEGLPFEV